MVKKKKEKGKKKKKLVKMKIYLKIIKLKIELNHYPIIYHINMAKNKKKIIFKKGFIYFIYIIVLMYPFLFANLIKISVKFAYT